MLAPLYLLVSWQILALTSLLLRLQTRLAKEIAPPPPSPIEICLEAKKCLTNPPSLSPRFVYMKQRGG
jgi:hypothetical protein